MCICISTCKYIYSYSYTYVHYIGDTGLNNVHIANSELLLNMCVCIFTYK
jgi:hypothetical protein